jgi:hypothetical protein
MSVVANRLASADGGWVTSATSTSPYAIVRHLTYPEPADINVLAP